MDTSAGYYFRISREALLYLLGRRLADVPASVMACLIMAIAVPELNHSQEVRMYTMASILTLASTYLLFSWIESQRLGVLVVHIGVTYLAFLTAPTVIFGLLLAGGMCGVVLVYRRNWTAALAIAIGYGLRLLAWLPLKRYAKLALSYGSLSWVPRPSRSALLLLHGSFFERCRVKSTLLISSRPHPRQINNLSKNGHRSGSVVFRSRAAGA